MVGLQNVIDTAHRLGIKAELLAYPSMALGSFEITLWRCLRVLRFANEGLAFTPYSIERITDSDGDVLEQSRPDPGKSSRPRTRSSCSGCSRA